MAVGPPVEARSRVAAVCGAKPHAPLPEEAVRALRHRVADPDLALGGLREEAVLGNLLQGQAGADRLAVSVLMLVLVLRVATVLPLLLMRLSV